MDKNRIRASLLSNTERSRPAPLDSAFSAAYFPWSVILNQATLKRALLYFDHVYLLAPTAARLDEFLGRLRDPERPEWMRSPGLDTQLRHSITHFYDGIGPLRRAGIIKTLDADAVLANDASRGIIEALSATDVLNYDMSKIRTTRPVELAIVDRHLLHAREISDGNVAFQYWDRAVIESAHPRVLADVEKFVQSLPLAARSFIYRSIGERSQAVTRALLLNSSLLSMNEAGLTPLVDDVSYFELIRAKYRAIFDASQNKNASKNTRSMHEFVAKSATTSGLLAGFLLEVALPNVDYASLEDVIELRERFSSELQSFRSTMIAISSRIRGSIGDPEFIEEAQRMLTAETLPALDELRAQLRLSNLKMLKEFVASAMSIKPTVPFIIAALTPVPLYAAALVAAGVVTLDAAIKTYISRQDLLYNNGLAYLIDLDRAGLGNGSLWNRSAAWSARYGV